MSAKLRRCSRFCEINNIIFSAGSVSNNAFHQLMSLAPHYYRSKALCFTIPVFQSRVEASSAAKNFVPEWPVNDVVLSTTVPSVYFLTVEN